VSTILIATDGSEPARKATAIGLELAAALGDDVLFVAVWHPIYMSTFGVPPTYFGSDMIEAEKQWATQALEAAAAEAELAGVKAATELLEGLPAEQICHLADQRHVRMIVIGSHGWGAVRSMLSRSTVTGVLAHAACPVLLGTPASVAAQAPSTEVGQPA
jgi:nucleotide-binding universal stress UspA family protein